MPTEIVFVAEDAPEGSYTARALGASIFTEADTLEALQEDVRDPVRCHFEEPGFGSSLSLSGDGATLVIGAIGEDGYSFGANGDQQDNTAIDSGAVYVFVR